MSIAFPQAEALDRKSLAGTLGWTGGCNSNSVEGDKESLTGLGNNKEVLLKLYPNWVSGFVTAEGSFIVVITKSANYNTGSQVSIAFKISQNLRDV